MYAIIDEKTDTVLSVHSSIQSALRQAPTLSEGEVHDISRLHPKFHAPLKAFLRGCFPRGDSEFRMSPSLSPTSELPGSLPK